MPRRKAATALNNNEDAEPIRKMQRISFNMPVPAIPHITGIVLTCGQGDMGQLGLGEDDTKMERKRPAHVDSIKDVVYVSAGGMHNLCLTKSGELYSFGCNDEGALGRDSSEEGSEFEPKSIVLPGKCVKISSGDSHSACLLDDGRVYAWGSFRNSHGNMGLTLEGNKRLPVEVLPGITSCDIASGADHLVILTCGGKVYTLGSAEQGQLGRVSLRSASGDSRRGKGDLLRPGLVTIKSKKPIEAIWATTYCTFLREKDTTIIWAFGLNNYKQLAYAKNGDVIINPINNTEFENVQMIAGGQHHTLVLKTDGSCYAIGRKDYGRLGLGTLSEDVKELQHIKSLDGKKVVHISCGEATSFALTEDGKLYAWGIGSNQQLGTGSEDDAIEPALIISKQTQDKRIIQASGGGQHSIFLAKDDNQDGHPTLTAQKTIEPYNTSTPMQQQPKKPLKETKKAANTAAKAAAVETAVKPKENKANGNDGSDGEVESTEVESIDGIEQTAAVPEATKQPEVAAPKRGRKKK